MQWYGHDDMLKQSRPKLQHNHWYHRSHPNKNIPYEHHQCAKVQPYPRPTERQHEEAKRERSIDLNEKN